MSKYLQGGRQKEIIKAGGCVYRTTCPWSNQVHNFLIYLRKECFLAAPEPFGFDNNGHDIISFIEGEVSNYPLSFNAASIKALVSIESDYPDISREMIRLVLRQMRDESLVTRSSKGRGTMWQKV